jgi:hypothetical protein
METIHADAFGIKSDSKNKIPETVEAMLCCVHEREKGSSSRPTSIVENVN